MLGSWTNKRKLDKGWTRLRTNIVKKTADKAKIKSSASKVVKTKKLPNKAHQPCQKSTDSKTVQPNSMADETLLQLKIDQRLQELSDLAKSGTFFYINRF